MYKKGTVFIIGAGASAEVNFPTGAKLMESISSGLDFRFEFSSLSKGDSEIYNAVNELHHEDLDRRNELYHAGQQITRGLPLATSIDNYLHTHGGNPDIVLCGKLAIARYILRAERDSKLFISADNRDQTFDVRAFEDTWFRPFAKKLMEGYKADEIGRVFENISIICFNYDRCIQHFLTHALTRYFNISKIEASEAMQNLEILHPYGMLGDLPISAEGGLPFGAEPHPGRLNEVSSNISTFTEEIRDRDTIEKISRKIGEARHLVFLGFGYLAQNMQILSAPLGDKKRIISSALGTAYGVSNSDIEAIEQNIIGLNPAGINKILLNNKITCRAFFDEHWHSL